MFIWSATPGKEVASLVYSPLIGLRRISVLPRPSRFLEVISKDRWLTFHIKVVPSDITSLWAMSNRVGGLRHLVCLRISAPTQSRPCVVTPRTPRALR